MNNKFSRYFKRPVGSLAEGGLSIAVGSALILAATGVIGRADLPRGDEYNGIYAILATYFLLYGITQFLDWAIIRKSAKAGAAAPAVFILSKFQNGGIGWVVFIVTATISFSAWREFEFAADYTWILSLMIGIFCRHIYHRSMGYRLASYPSESLRKMWLDLGRIE